MVFVLRLFWCASWWLGTLRVFYGVVPVGFRLYGQRGSGFPVLCVLLALS